MDEASAFPRQEQVNIPTEKEKQKQKQRKTLKIIKSK